MISAHIFCSNCGAKNEKNAAFCFACGRQLTHPVTTTGSMQIQPEQPTYVSPAGGSATGAGVQTTQDQPSASPQRSTGQISPERGATTTNPNDRTPPASANITGFLSTNTILKQRYRILHTVGKGGMGAVYMGNDTQLGNRLVAIKEMSQLGLYPDEAQTAAENFKREAHLLAGLHHPNLPSIYDHFQENQRWYLVMSFIQGETLQEHLQYTPGGKLPLEEVLQIGIELSTVLHYLHSYQPPVIFRDLKPANVMRDKNGHIYLIDFGIARHFKPGQEKDTASYVSTGYAPPEQYGLAQTTPRSDIYSLGAMLYHLLSGYSPSQSPFRLPPLQSLMPTLPPRLTALITQMLDLEENRRPADMLTIKQELQAISSAPTSPAAIQTPPQQQPEQVSRQEHGAVTPTPLAGTNILARIGATLGGILLLAGFFLTFVSVLMTFVPALTIWSLLPLDFLSPQQLFMISVVDLLATVLLTTSLAKNLRISDPTTISRGRRTVATIGTAIATFFFFMGIWAWKFQEFIYRYHPFYHNSEYYYYYYTSPDHILQNLSFILIGLTGMLMFLATTTRSFGLSATKIRQEASRKIAFLLGIAFLTLGITFLIPTSLQIGIPCTLIGGVILFFATRQKNQK